MRESILIKRVRDRYLGKGHTVIRMNGGILKSGRHFTYRADIGNIYIQKGLPDMMIIPNDSPAFFVEAKTKNDRLSPLQIAVFSLLVLSGHRVFVERQTDMYEYTNTISRTTAIEMYLKHK